MSAQPSAGRTRRPMWFDPRFAIGIILVVASIVGVYALVATADKSTTVYAAKAPIAAGDRVRAADLATAEVRLGSADRFYLTSADVPAAGIVVNRTVAAGELIPASAVGSAARASVTSVVLEAHGALAASVAAGAVVDVWAAPELDHGAYGPPAVLVDAATVVRLVDDDDLVADGDTVSVEVQVPRAKVAAVLEAQANADIVSVVPASTPLEG